MPPRLTFGTSLERISDESLIPFLFTAMSWSSSENLHHMLNLRGLKADAGATLR